MLSIKLQPIPKPFFFFSTFLAIGAIFSAALSFHVQTTLAVLCLAFAMLSYRFGQKKRLLKIEAPGTGHGWKLYCANGHVIEEALLANSYLSRWVLLLRWPSGQAALFCWQYDAAMWRKIQMSVSWK